MLFFLTCFCAYSLGLSLLNETVKCSSYCEKTYPLHTYPTVKHFQACQHGCFCAAKQKSWSDLGLRLKHVNCSQECKTKFATGSYYACKLGCTRGKNIDQEPGPTRKSTPPEDEQHSTLAAMILRPVFLLRTYGSGMINRITYYIQSSTSYYFRANNGAMVVVNIQDQPQVYVSSSNYYHQYPEIQNDDLRIGQTDQTPSSSYVEQHESWIVVRRGHHWLHCVSHKSGVPMWILSSILFLSSFFLLWLCCAATVTSPSAKKSCRPEKKAFLIKEFLSASQKDGADVPLLSLDDNEKQAEALPPKDKPVSVISI